jgi:hypothetical protein
MTKNLIRYVDDETVNFTGSDSEDYVDDEDIEGMKIESNSSLISVWKLKSDVLLNLYASKNKDSQDLEEVLNINNIPTLTINTDLIKQTIFIFDLIFGLNMNLRFDRSFFPSDFIDFDYSVIYSEDVKDRFIDLIKNRKAYLHEDSNYFEVDESKISEGTLVRTLINSRVVLFWRDVSLSEVTIKRIMTLGLAFLIKGLSVSELVFYVKEVLPYGEFSVSVVHHESNYVVIGVENPLFKF